MHVEVHPSQPLKWTFLVSCLLVFVAWVMLAASGIEVDCYSTYRKTIVIVCCVLLFVLTFAFIGTLNQFPNDSQFFKAVVYSCAPLSILVLAIASTGDERCKIDWAVAALTLCVLLLVAFWVGFKNRLVPSALF